MDGEMELFGGGACLFLACLAGRWLTRWEGVVRLQALDKKKSPWAENRP